MLKFWKYFKSEWITKLFSSKKKIIKFIAISFVPFLYGFICIYAFWNPVAEIGAVPMAIVDNSKRISLAVGTIETNGKKRIVIGEADENSIDPTTNKPTHLKVLNLNTNTYEPIPNDSSSTFTCYSYYPNYSFVESFIRGWTDEVSSTSVITRNPDRTFTINLNEENQLHNVGYFNNYATGSGGAGKEENTVITTSSRRADSIANFDPDQISPVTGVKGSWKVDDENYWLQIQIPQNFNTIFANTLLSMYNPPATPTTFSTTEPEENEPITIDNTWFDQLSELKKTPINIWTTFKKNFLFGQFMKVFNELKSSMIIDFYPRLLIQTMVNMMNTIYQTQSEKYIFTPTTDINIPNAAVKYHVGSNVNSVPARPIENNYSLYQGPIMIPANTSIVFRNDEFRDVVKNDANTSAEDQMKLNDIRTFEGNTTQLISEQNDWELSDNVSYIDLIEMIVRPVTAALFPSTKTYNSLASLPINKDDIIKCLKNKMFMTSILENDKHTLPVKSITGSNIINKDRFVFDAATLGIKIFQDTTKIAFPYVFSDNNKTVDVAGNNLSQAVFYAHKNDWVKYTNTIPSALRDVISNVISNHNHDHDPNAPPVNNELITSGVIGEEYSVYGIGLGQFFLFISIWVGVLMLTFVLDRKRRGPAAKPELLTPQEVAKNKKITKWVRFREAFTWWWSKIAVMMVMVVIQVTILSLTLYGLGYHVLGSTFGLLYLELLFSGLEFAIFIGALWLFFRDDVVGKFIAILFLIINLSSGWGTFPPSMQAPIFQVLSYIAPFTYAIKNIGAIVYGIGVVGANWQDQAFILGNIGISCIYIVIGILIGCLGCMRLTKMQFYGARHKKKLAISLMEQAPAVKYAVYSLNYQYHTFIQDSDCQNLVCCAYQLQKAVRTSSNPYTLTWQPRYDYVSEDLHLQYLLPIQMKYHEVPEDATVTETRHIHFYVNWNKLPYSYQAAITHHYNERFPFDERFAWWRQKHPCYVELEDAVI